MTRPGYCSQCGAELSPGFRFCPGCGAATSGTAAPRVPAATIDTASGADPKPPSPASERALKDFEAQFDALKKRVSTKKSHSILTDPELGGKMRFFMMGCAVLAVAALMGAMLFAIRFLEEVAKRQPG